jgi:hypothetical protein
MTVYAQWDGSQGYGLQNDNKGYLASPVDGHRIAVDTAADFGLYPVTFIEPVFDEATQTKDAESWIFDGSALECTWTVRAKTQEELDIYASEGVMSEEMYNHIRWLRSIGHLTVAETDQMPQVMRDAFQARARLAGDA